MAQKAPSAQGGQDQNHNVSYALLIPAGSDPSEVNDRVERVDRGIQSFPRNASSLQPNDGVRNMNQAKENRHQGRNYKGDEPSRLLNRVHNSTFYSSLAKKLSQSGTEKASLQTIVDRSDSFLS